MPESLSVENPFARESDLPYALPPFGRIRPEHYRPAFEAGAAEQRAEVAAIVADHEEPTFENTIVTLERSGRLLERVLAVFFNLAGSDATAEMLALEEDLAPAYAAHRDAIRLDPGLFARVDAVHSRRDETDLSDEERVLVERYHLDFVLSGARLDATGRERLKELNQEIARLGAAFTANLIKDTEQRAVHLTEPEQLAGAGDDALEAARAAAAGRGLGGYLITLVLPTQQPLLASLRDREVRRRLYQASVGRASSGELDNAPIAGRIAELRAEAAGLLGFPTHADLVAADQTARTTDAIDQMLGRLLPPTMANTAAEAEALTERAAQDGIDLEPWDWAYYSARVEEERFDIDTEAMRPYLELDRVLHEGVFHAAHELYGLRFESRPDLDGYHPDVRVWEVFDADDRPMGLYLGDFLARDTKRGGAWMSCFVEQNHLHGDYPVVVNNLNLTPAPEGRPILLSLDNVRTLFHEFGHTLHGLLSDVTYPRISSPNVPRDFVEYPSQVNEMWMFWPSVLERFAVHHETGERLSAGHVQAIQAAEQWGQGFATCEMLGAVLLDQAWHRLRPGETVADPAAFERDALERSGVRHPLVPPRYSTPYFAHVFSGDGGYSAGYYSYLWSEVFDADTVDWFKANGGLTRANGDRFRRELLSVGGSTDPVRAFEAVVGHPADVEPLLRRRGLADDRTP